LVLWASITLLLFISGGISNFSVFGYFLLIGITGLLLGERSAFVLAFSSLLAILGLYYAEVNGAIAVRVRTSTSPTELTMLVIGLIMVSLLVRFVVNTIAQGLERARRNERALAEKNRELEAGQQVTLAASRRVNPDELLNLVVNLVRDQFALYHVQVYIVDEERGAAVLRKSTGYAGRQLLQKKHHILLDQPALVTQAIREGQSVLVNDVSRDPNFMPNPLLPDTRSELVVPLKVGARVIGVLDIQDRITDRFAESTVNLFQTMAGQIAFLFENSELLERVSEQADKLTGFTDQLRISADIAEQLGTILEPERLLQQAVELMQSRFGLYHAHVYVLDEKRQELIVRAGSGEVGRVLCERGHSIPLDAEKSLVARTARSQEIVLVNDTRAEPTFMPNPLLPRTRSEMAIPLAAGDKVLGVLDVQDDMPYRFTQTDQDTFSTLAGQIATALQNADLFEQVGRSLAETQARFEVSQALAGAQTEDQVLDAMIQAADFYPQAQVAILTFDTQAEERTTVARRVEAFDSGLASLFQPGMSFTASQFPLRQLISSDRPFVSPNLFLDERADPATCEMTRQAGAVSIAVLPITAGSEWMGLVVALAKEEKYFDQRKLLLYQSLAEQGAIALHAARLSDNVHRSEERLRRILEASPVPMVISRVADGTVLYGNKYLGGVFGVPYEELIGNKTPDFYHDPADRQVILQTLRRDGYVYQKEIRLKKADGSTFWALLSNQVTTFDGEPAIISAVYDITDHRRDDILADLNRELRTPLNSILGYTEMLLTNKDDQIASDSANYIQAVHNSGKQLLDAINDALDLAKIEAGQMTLSFEKVQVESLLNDVEDKTAELLISKPVELIVQIEKDIPVIRGDPLRLNQALSNITFNAARFTDDGSITLRAYSNNGWICIEVKDTGIGSSVTGLENGFEKSEQIDAASTGSAKGTKLGLSVAHHLVQMHRGKLDVSSQPGEGSTFTMHLPVQRQTRAIAGPQTDKS
jgi:PAS domain S-box-containing protein